MKLSVGGAKHFDRMEGTASRIFALRRNPTRGPPSLPAFSSLPFQILC